MRALRYWTDVTADHQVIWMPESMFRRLGLSVLANDKPILCVQVSTHLCLLHLTSPLGEIDLEQVRLATASSHYGLSVSLYQSVPIVLVGLLPGQWLFHFHPWDQGEPQRTSSPSPVLLCSSLLFTSISYTLTWLHNTQWHDKPHNICYAWELAIKERNINSLVYTLDILWAQILWSK